MDYEMEGWYSPHSALGLLNAIHILQNYPDYENIVESLKKDLEKRFVLARLNKKGNKVLNGIVYFPSGLVKSKYHYEQGSGNIIGTLLNPFKVESEKKNKRKVSKTRSEYKHKYGSLGNLYTFLVYSKLGIKVRIMPKGCNYFDEANANLMVEIAKKIESQPVPEELKTRFYEDLKSGILNNGVKRYYYSCSSREDIDKIYVEEFVKRVIGDFKEPRSAYYWGTKAKGKYPWLFTRGDEYYSNNDKVVWVGSSRYMLKFILPSERVIQNCLDERMNWGDRDEIYDRNIKAYVKTPFDYNVVTINANNIQDLIAKFKEEIMKVNNPNIPVILRKMGLHMEDKELNDNQKDIEVENGKCEMVSREVQGLAPGLPTP